MPIRKHIATLKSAWQFGEGRVRNFRRTTTTRNTVTLCCMTYDPPSQVAAILSLLRPVVNEVIVAIDSRVDHTALGCFSGLCDKLFEFEFHPPVDRPRAWLASQARGDWLLWIDGDEVPSPSLIAAIPRLVEDRSVLQFWFSRRWLFPDTRHWLKEQPWWPDFQLRLMRNDPATLWFGSTHEPFGVNWPSRFVDAPIYHLAALAPEPFRLEKIHKYEAERPGMISPVGGPFNEVMLLPERHARLQPLDVPPDDYNLLVNVLAGRSGSATRRPPSVTKARADEISALSSDRTLTENDYRATIKLIEPPPHFAPGRVRWIAVCVKNEGRMTWPGQYGRTPTIYASYHWYSADGVLLVGNEARTCMPSKVAPGESVIVPLHVEPPNMEGQFILELDLVHENVRWFGCNVRTPAEVRVPAGAPRVAKERPKLSVAICTYQRSGSLRKAIDSLLRQTLPRDAIEVLIINNAPDNADVDALKAHYASEQFISWHHESVVGLSQARNFAARTARGEILAFMDDDAVADTKWAASLLAAFDRFGPQTHAVGGSVDPIWSSPRPNWLHHDLLGYLSIVDWGGSARIASSSEWLAGTNVAFRAEILQSIGFATNLGRRGKHILLSNEEQEVLDLVRSGGGLVVYEPGAKLQHAIPSERLTQAWFRKRAIWQALSDFMRHGELYEQSIEQHWDRLRALQAAPAISDWSALGRETDDPAAFKQQIFGLHELTLLMLSGLRGSASK